MDGLINVKAVAVALEAIDLILGVVVIGIP